MLDSRLRGAAPDVPRPVPTVAARRAHRSRVLEPSKLLGSNAVRELVALAFLTAVILVAFRAAIFHGVLAFENDTEVFYYPLDAWFGSQFKSGHFPLWNPFIFAGYPLFADGEIGLAYPIHLFLLALLPFQQAFIWLRISSVLIAAGGMYALCRVLLLNRYAAIMGALTFSLGCFFVAQQHHENVTRTGAWLPLVLACTEWGLRVRGWHRYLMLSLSGLALAMAALGLHPQVLAMSCLAYAGYVVWRVLVGPLLPAGEERRWRAPAIIRCARWFFARLGLVVLTGGYVGALGLGLAAVQLLPVAEMASATFRATQPDYAFATSYALPMQNLITLVLPYFFRGPEAATGYWSLSAPWETALYVGIAPLVLGLVGIVCARRREVYFFAFLALIALWLAFASYAPFDLYHILWQLPGFAGFRVPGRYVYLFVFSWSVLAAFGMQALSLRSAAGWRERMRIPIVLILIGASCLVGVWLMVRLRASLVSDPVGSQAWINAAYLSLRHTAQGLNPGRVYDGLVFSLGHESIRTTVTFLLMPTVLVLTFAAVMVRRWSGVWQAALIGVTVVDLLGFGGSFHPEKDVAQLSTETGAVAFIQGMSHPKDDPARIFTPGTIPSLEFDRLVPFGIEDVGGYSSLESRLNFEYWATAAGTQGRLLDLANVRFITRESGSHLLPSYRNVSYDPDRPLVVASAGALDDGDVYTPDPVVANRLQVLAALTR